MSYKQKCFFCEYKTTRKDSFHRHLIAKHSEKKEKDTLCSVCGQVFFLYIDLKLHIDQKHPTKHVREAGQYGRVRDDITVD